MEINCIAIDDEPLALQQIISYIEKTPFLRLIKGCYSAVEALDIITEHKIELMFVDINMPDLSGMDFVKSLNFKPMIVFTTAYSEYALEGFKVEALDYLLKPISYADFLKSANKAKKQKELLENSLETIKSDNEYIFIKSEYKILRINYKDIIYIEGMKEYVRIHLQNAKAVMTLLSMKSLENHLPKEKFMRVHRSYIVNLKMINQIERNRIVFNQDTYIPISEQYKVFFQKYLDENFMK